MTDAESRKLLTLLHKYVLTYAPDIPVTIPALAEDLAMSLDEASDRDNDMRHDIEQIIGI